MTDDQVPDVFDELLARARELEAQGVEPVQASQLAWLERRVQSWPSGWGNDLHVLVYGDFDPISGPLEFPELGITVLSEALENTPIRSARTVHKAIVTVSDKSVASLVDAARRINLLLGAWTLANLGNQPPGWWSWVTHDVSGGVVPVLGMEVRPFLAKIQHLDEPLRRKLAAAMYWIREPSVLMGEFPRSGTIRTYAAYWNALECLVEGAQHVWPLSRLEPAKKREGVRQFFAELDREPTPGDVQSCYLKFVNPGFVGNAKNVLTAAFGEDGQTWIDECFEKPDEASRLYNVRNAINHGEIDAENPEELIRVESRLARLQELVMTLFARVFKAAPARQSA